MLYHWTTEHYAKNHEYVDIKHFPWRKVYKYSVYSYNAKGQKSKRFRDIYAAEMFLKNRHSWWVKGK